MKLIFNLSVLALTALPPPYSLGTPSTFTQASPTYLVVSWSMKAKDKMYNRASSTFSFAHALAVYDRVD